MQAKEQVLQADGQMSKVGVNAEVGKYVAVATCELLPASLLILLVRSQQGTPEIIVHCDITIVSKALRPRSQSHDHRDTKMVSTPKTPCSICHNFEQSLNESS